MQSTDLSRKKYIAVLFFLIPLVLTTFLVTGVINAETRNKPISGTGQEPVSTERFGRLGDASFLYGNVQTREESASQNRTTPGDLPKFTVTTWPGETGEGYIFMAYYNYWWGLPSAYLLILEDDGEPVFYKQLAPVVVAMDFKKQPNGLLTYYPLTNGNRFLALDNSYEVVQTYEAGNGYLTDFHDLQILENGNALLMIYDRRTVDMSQIVDGGNPEAEVIGCIIQEIDSEQNVVFEWQSWGNIPIQDSNRPLTDSSINYMNCNSLELDDDGHILLSSRNLDEVTKINRQTGEIIWRMGVRQDDFTFTNDVGFNFAHDARRLDNGNITIFDNGIAHSPPFSRGIEYKVDELNKTVTRVREFRDDPDQYSRALGNMQQLPNGNMLIGWGRSIDIPVFTEFDANGEKILEFRATPGNGSYRVFRFPWKGYPTWPAALVAENIGGTARLYFSWNGSTETEAFQVFGGRDRSNLGLLATVIKDGFETTFDYDVAQEGLWYFKVVPVDGKGATGVPSKLVPLAVGEEPLYFPMVQTAVNE